MLLQVDKKSNFTYTVSRFNSISIFIWKAYYSTVYTNTCVTNPMTLVVIQVKQLAGDPPLHVNRNIGSIMN